MKNIVMLVLISFLSINGFAQEKKSKNKKNRVFALESQNESECSSLKSFELEDEEILNQRNW